MGRLQDFEKECAANEPEDLKDYSGESVIEWLRGDKDVTVSFPAGTRECNRVIEYAKDYPNEVKIVYQNSDGSIVARVPRRYLKISRPAEREMTEEQRQAASERLRLARERAKMQNEK